MLDIPNLLVPNHGARGASFRKRYCAAGNRICDCDARVVHLVRELCPAAPHGFLDYGPRFWLCGFHSITSMDSRRCGKPGNESFRLNIFVHADAENVFGFFGAAFPSVPLNA